MDDVVIVGAGPTGLTLAVILRAFGVRCRCLDRNAGPVTESRATDVHARTLELFDTLGVSERLVAAGARARTIHFYGGTREIACLPMHELPSPFPFVLGIPQGETERILVERLDELGGTVERNAEVVALTQHDDHVALQVEREGAREDVRARWVVGCDGARSFVREALGLRFEGDTYPEWFGLADAKLRFDRPSDALHIGFSAEGFFTVLPLPGERWCRLFVDLPEPGEGEGPPDVETFRGLAERRSPFPVEVEEVGWTSRFRVHRKLVPRYRVGRAFVAGDAAHVHSPVGGQGMNTGVQDAFNLGWKLAMVCRGEAREELLESYHAERHPVGAMTVWRTDVATRASLIRHPVIAAVRDGASALSMGVPVLSRWVAEVTAALHVHYRDSPAVGCYASSFLTTHVISGADSEIASVYERLEFQRGPKPGERAPDRQFGLPEDRRWFFRLRSTTQPLVLLFDGATPTPAGYLGLAELSATIRARYGARLQTHVVVPYPDLPEVLRDVPDVLLDPGGDLHCGFGARAECAYVVRPDGYVGFRAQPALPEAVLEYLALHFDV